MKKCFKNILKGQVAAAVLYILMGVCLIAMPVASIYVICKVIFGVMLIAGGLHHIWLYIQEKEHATILDLFSGAILLVFGGFLFYNPQIVVKLLPVLFGVFVLVDSIWAFRGAVRLKKRNRKEWKLLVIIRVVFLVFGVALIVNPFTVVKYTAVFAGWITLANGICDLLFFFLLRKWMKAAEIEIKESAPDEMEQGKEQESASDEKKPEKIKESVPENVSDKAEEVSTEEKQEEQKEVLTFEEEALSQEQNKKTAVEFEEPAKMRESEKTAEKPTYHPEEEPATSIGEVLRKKAEDMEEVLEEWVDRD